MRRTRRTREGLREELLESALIEFAAKGFEGASTRSIAERVDAHQPQINYHFASKDALWEAAVDHLFGLLAEAFGDVPPLDEADDPVALGQTFAETLRRFVRFAAAHPELNRIMVHEGTMDSARSRWLVEHHVRGFYDAVVTAWVRLRDAGIAAPVDPDRVYWVIVGAASLPFVNVPEVRLLTDADPADPAWVEAHADGVVGLLLPGLERAVAPAGRQSSGRARRSTRGSPAR